MPFELEILDSSKEAWLPLLIASIQEDTYSPDTATIVELPKARGLVRPIALMSLRDRVVYNASIQACFPNIFAELSWSQGSRDFAYSLRPPDRTPPWFKNAFRGWIAFRKASLSNLASPCVAVAITDVAGFYENISISRLISDLQSIGCNEHAVHLISRQLNRWCQVEGRGIPQDAWGSHVLAKLYLNPIDRRFAHAGRVHTRYSDDIRIFCESSQAAEVALVETARAMRRRGLSLQGAKTKVVPRDQARAIIEGRTPTIARIRRDWRQAIIDAIGDGEDADYLTVAEIDSLIQNEPERIPVDVLRGAFDAFIQNEADDGFDKSVFHFLLNRLAKAGDKHAIRYLAAKLITHPQETSFILRYVRQVDAETEFEPALIAFLRSAQGSVYDAQRLIVLAWWSQGTPSIEAAELARGVAFSADAARITRAAARAVLAAHAELADLERLQEDYDRSGDELERAQILCCLRRLEKSRRRAFVARAKADGPLPEYASIWLATQE